MSQEFEDGCQEYIDEIELLKEQVDELLKAAKAAEDFIGVVQHVGWDCIGSIEPFHTILQKLQVAIEKAEKGKFIDSVINTMRQEK